MRNQPFFGIILFIFIFICLGISNSSFAETSTLKIGVLKFGTVNWELLTLKRLKLDQKYGFNLKIKPSAGKAGSVIAFQGKETDVMVTDWIWVSNQRAKGAKITCVPYSKTVGALLVQKNSSIKSIGDLVGKKVGIVGGPLDKSWLLLQAVSIKQLGYNIKEKVDAAFGSPVLITKKFEQGELDAIFNFWHFVAKLNAKGYPTLLDAEGLMRQMGVLEASPLLAYTFRDDFAEANQPLIQNFIKAVYETKQILSSSDEAWEPIRKTMRAKDDKTYQTLIARWRAGIPRSWGTKDFKNAEMLFSVLHKIGGKKLIKSDQLSPGTFWSEFSL